MAAKKMTEAQIDAHVEKVSKKALPKGKSFDLAKSYVVVRPILVFATGFLGMFKPKWVPIVQQFIDGLDAFTKYKPI